MESRDIVAYFRVSSGKQGIRGLGMDAQRASIAAYAERSGSAIIARYNEVESARREHLRNRPELVKALSHARRCNALLVIARLDRLTRSVYVTSQLLNSGVEFLACDIPHANRLTIQVLAVLAEHESRCISERVKGAIAAARLKGRVWHGKRKTKPDQEAMKKAARASARARTLYSHEIYSDLLPFVRNLREKRLTFLAIAEILNDQGHRSQRNTLWQGQTVMRLLQREGFGHLAGPRAPKTKPRRVPIGKEATTVLKVQRLRRFYALAFEVASAEYAKGMSLGGIARQLNASGIMTQRGGAWNCVHVKGVLRRGGALTPQRPPHSYTPAGFEQSRSIKESVSARAGRAGTSHVAVFAIRLYTAGQSVREIVEKLRFYGFRSRRGYRIDHRGVKSILSREGLYDRTRPSL